MNTTNLKNPEPDNETLFERFKAAGRRLFKRPSGEPEKPPQASSEIEIDPKRGRVVGRKWGVLAVVIIVLAVIALLALQLIVPVLMTFQPHL